MGSQPRNMPRATLAPASARNQICSSVTPGSDPGLQKPLLIGVALAPCNARGQTPPTFRPRPFRPVPSAGPVRVGSRVAAAGGAEAMGPQSSPALGPSAFKGGGEVEEQTKHYLA